jgi:hypothetical protein
VPKGQNGRALGGFSTKIPLVTDFKGNPLDCHLTGGAAGDSRQFCGKWRERRSARRADPFKKSRLRNFRATAQLKCGDRS